MAVLVTRPDKQGTELTQMLNQQGITALHHPLIHIEAGSDLPLLSHALSQANFVIIASQHAVYYGQQQLQTEQASWPSSPIYLAIGQKSAQVLGKYLTQHIHYPQIGESEHLLCLPQLQQVANQRILILRGNGGRNLMNETLTHRGAQVQMLALYHRIALPFNASFCVAQWQETNIQHIVVTSSQQLALLVAPFRQENTDWLFKRTLLVPSLRIAQEAKALGFQQILTIGSAANHDFIAALTLNS